MMLKRTFGAVLCCCVTASVAAQTIQISNPGFETSDPKEWTSSWTTLQHAGEVAYRFKSDATDPQSGKLSAQIEQYAPQAFGLFKQRIDIRSYVGKRIRVSAFLKSKDLKEGGGGLYVRIDGQSDAILGNDFSSGATKGSHGWKPFRAVVEIPSGALWMEFGVMLQDIGVMWADSFEVSVTTDPVTEVKVVPKGPTFDFQPVPGESRERQPRNRRVQP